MRGYALVDKTTGAISSIQKWSDDRDFPINITLGTNEEVITISDIASSPVKPDCFRYDHATRTFVAFVPIIIPPLPTEMELLQQKVSINSKLLNLTPPVEVPITLLDYQQNKIYELNVACNNAILAGFTSTATGVPHQYKFDMEYQANLNQELTMLLADISVISVNWPTKDGGVIAHTRLQFIQLCKDSKTFKETNIYRYFGLKAQVMSSTTITQVNTFIW